jgi:hypothetical protein
MRQDVTSVYRGASLFDRGEILELAFRKASKCLPDEIRFAPPSGGGQLLEALINGSIYACG